MEMLSQKMRMALESKVLLLANDGVVIIRRQRQRAHEVAMVRITYNKYTLYWCIVAFVV